MPVALIWLIAALALAGAEALTGDMFLLMLGGGALAAAGIESGRSTTCGCTARCSWWCRSCCWCWCGPRCAGISCRARVCRNRSKALEGKSALVLDRVARHEGQVKLDGEVWTARPFNDDDVYEPGDHVTVVHIDGATAVVSKSRLEKPGQLGKEPVMEGAVAGLVLVGVLVVFAAIIVAKSIALIPQAEAAVIERLGRYSKTVSGQLTLLLPFVDKIRARVDLRERVVSFPPQPVITEDNLTVNIDTVVYFQVTNPQAAVYQISNYIVGVEQLTTTTLRNVVGGMTLEQTLTSRDQINGQLRGVLDEATGRWGLRVARVELRSIDPPPSIQDSMEKQMRADREKRAMILTAEGSREASIKQAEGQKQAQILAAEGAKQAAILAAEADRQSRMLRAQGERAASYLQAQGQAKAIEKTFAAIKAGRPTPEMLAYQYLQTLPQMAKGEANKVWLVPSDFGVGAAGVHQDARRARRGRRVPVHAVAGGGEPAASPRTTPPRSPTGSPPRPTPRSLRRSPRPRRRRAPRRASVPFRPRRRIPCLRCSIRRCHSSGRTVRRRRLAATAATSSCNHQVGWRGPRAPTS